MKKLYVFRHGETDWNRDGRFQGHIDIPMNETGRMQARALAPLLEAHQIEAIYTSDLLRAQETARIIAGTLGVPVFISEKLREAHLGEAQGLTREEIVQKFGPETLARWRSGLPMDAEVAYSGGESGKEVGDRFFAAVREFLKIQPFQRVGISTHGGVIRRMMERILSDREGHVPIPNGILYVIGHDPLHDHWEVLEGLAR
jgi:probable phosphoglycerate mutase